MIRKLLFSTNLFVFLITASSLYAGDPIRSNKLVYFSQFNTLTSSYPVSQSSSNFDSNLVASATIDYGGSGISSDNFARTSWNITNTSSTLDPATAPYVEYAINFNNSVNIDLDRFVITGGASNYSTKFELRWSKDNYATRLGLFSVGSDWQYKLTSVNLNTLSNFTGTQLKFRLYFYDTSASGSNFVHSDTGPYTSLDGTPSSYDIWTATATIWVNPPPAISSITPSTVAIGSTVVITGTDFTGATAVSFNGTNATSFIVDSPTQITATVPVGTTTGPITVTTPNGTGTSASNFTVLPPPTITSFTPSSGAVGTSVTVTGTNFTSATAVSIGGTPVTSFTINSATSITAVVAAGISGKIQVTTPGGTGESTSNFTLPPTITTTGTSAITAMSTCKNSASAAQTFTVSGFNLVGNLSVGSDDVQSTQFSINGVDYASSVSLVPTNGSVAETTVYMRTKSLSTPLTSNPFTVTISSSNATSATFSFTRVINDSTKLSGTPLGLFGGASQTYCINTTPYNFEATVTGLELTYQWYSNTTASTSGATLVTGATSSIYTPVTSTTSALYYYCVVTGTCGSVNTPFTGLIKVNALSVGGTATAAASSVCSGTTTTLSLVGNTGNIQWESSSNGISWTSVSGATTAIYTTPAITSNKYYRAKVTSSPCAGISYSTVASVSLNAATAITAQPSTTAQTYCQNGTPTDLSVIATGLGLTYQWYSNTTASTTGATLIAGATAATYTPDTTITSDLYYYCIVTGSCTAITSGFSGKITVIPSSIGGTATAAASSVCSGMTTTLSLAGNTGTIQWQQSADGMTSWGNVSGGSGATTATYTTPAITGTSYYRASVTVNSCVSNSTVTSVTINAITVQPSATAQNVCINGTPTDLSLTATGSGLNYQWYSNTTASTTGSTLIAGATAATYTPDSTTASVLYYYCVVTGTCGSVTSNFSGLITVSALAVGGTATAASSSVCSGTTTTLSLTGHAGSTIQWETSSDGTTGWTNVTGGSGATTATYTTPTVTGLLYYRAKVTSSSPCTGSSYSTVASVSLNAATAITAQPSTTAQTYCLNTTPTDLSVTATGLGLTYQWYKNTTASTSGATLVTGATSSIYTPVTSTTSALNYYCVVTGTCGSVTSGFSGLLTVNPLPVISGTTSVGIGETITLNGTTAAASSSPWVSSVPGVATVSNLGVVTALALGTTTITYTNTYGCTDTESITVTVGTTQPPTLTSPATGTSGVSTLNISYTLPELPLANSVRLTFTPTAGGTPIVWTMSNATAATFAYTVGTNPTSLSPIVSGSPLDFTTYNLTLSYQDVYGNPATSVTNTSIQILAPPANLSYSLPSTFIKDSVVTNIVPSITGTATSFSVSPALPTGLTLNTTTGVISGTPTVAATLTSYVVTATNSSGSTTYSLSFAVDKATPTIASMAAITKTFGDVPFTLTAPTSNGTGAFTFTSTDTAVATISGTTVTIVGAGTATITATQATDANYLVGSTSTTLTVNKATPVLSNFNAITTTIDSPSFTLTAPTSSGGTGAISYTSSNTAVATISGATVTMVGAGTAIITATQASDANYNSQSITALLTVGIGTTQSPILTSPATGTSGVSTLNIIYTLPETPLAGSVRLTFTPTAGGTPIVWTMSNATAATFAYTVGTNPTSLSPIVSGSPLAFTSYNITLSYQDVYGSPVASATNTSIQFLAPPNITLANTSYSGLVNTVFTTITVTSTGGAVSSFAISPNLPAGLTLNTTTGSISGTPTVALTATNFTITAINLTGTASVQFTLLINTGANNQIVDTDGDGVLDSIDTDDDGDGVLDVNDAFPINKNEWTDTDRDGIGNNADTDDDNDGILDGCDVDVNGDGIPDNGTDLDADGINDGCDTDKDGDGVNNTSDNCPNSPNTNQADRDRDGQGDICDTVELNVAQAITPNGDGINDTWVIYNLGYYPGATVRVFNTYGVQVFYSANYQNNWGGNYEGKNEMLPVGSYLYQIDLGSDGTIDYQGWLYITK